MNREQIEQRNDPSLIPLLTEYVPGLFTTSRGLMGYGVSGGAAGGISFGELGVYLRKDCRQRECSC